MDITKEMTMALPVEQARELHREVVVFVENNYEAVLDADLMDDILVREYRLGVEKLTSILDPETDQTEIQRRTLDIILMQTVSCAADNLSIGRTIPIYKEFLSCVAETINRLQEAESK